MLPRTIAARAALGALLALLCLGPVAPARAFPAAEPPQPAAEPGPCVEQESPVTDARLLFCVPASGWNGDLLVYAHGYVAPGLPLDFTNLAAPDGSSLPTFVQSLGLAFAATTYRQNGLAVVEGVEDVRETIAAFPAFAGRSPGHTYVLGISEGGLVATLLAERYPLAVSGALAACGPIGDFQRQSNYFSDVRVLFDYYFPGVLPPNAVSIPQELINGWESTYAPAVANAISTNPTSATLLLEQSGAPIDATRTVSTTLGALWYNVFATNDTAAKLGGNPYDNRDRFPFLPESLRFTADVTATAALGAYQTSGKLSVPLVTVHTTGDEIVPYWQEQLYADKVLAAGSRITQIRVQRYGHCRFQSLELVQAFNTLRAQVQNSSRVFLPLTVDGRG